jgi:hypothetical protein
MAKGSKPVKSAPAAVSKLPVSKAQRRDWIAIAETRAAWIAVALVLIGSLRIVGTYWVYNHTVDEMFHVACGVEWLTQGTYKQEAQHPPVGRILTGVGPWLDGAKLIGGNRNLYDEGSYVLYAGRDYDKRVALARAGVLPMFWIACWAVYAWSARRFDRLTGALAVLVLSNTPAVLAHSGLATTDMPFTAGFAVALLTLVAMLERPSIARGAVFGAGMAFAMATKFSTLLFFPACAIAAVVWLWRRGGGGLRGMMAGARGVLVPVPVAVCVCVVLVWGVYRFSWGPAPVIGISFAAPEFFKGIEEVQQHNAMGHPSWLLGSYSDHGFWYYYPVALFFKTPLALIALAGWGAWIAWRRREWRYWLPLAFLAGVLISSVMSRINIGTRHVLPVYIFMALLAAAAVREALSSGIRRRMGAGLALAALLVVSSAAAHPDYLPYFNLLAGDNPEEILVDSDLDWGQDMKRLGARLNELGAAQVALNPLPTGFWEEAHGFPKILPLDPRGPRPGWNAVSLTKQMLTRMGTREKFPNMQLWTDRATPVERVGKGMLLYYSAVQQ